jgi:hypothetical protein
MDHLTLRLTADVFPRFLASSYRHYVAAYLCLAGFIAPCLPTKTDKLPRWHHGRGVFGQLVSQHLKGTASPSSIRIAPTSRPLDFSVPQSLPWLQKRVPCVLAGCAAAGTLILGISNRVAGLTRVIVIAT